MSYDDIVEEALCFGWIDSLPKRIDDDRAAYKLTPRKKGSAWSRLNKERVEKLMAWDLMTEAGLRKIKNAQEDGSWSALDEVEAMIVPDDLDQALAENPAAGEGFEQFSPSVKKGLLWWVTSAKREATRSKRITQVVDGAAEGRNPLQKSS